MDAPAGLPEFAVRFRTLRERARLTRTALAEPRYTVSYVSQIESGRRRPSPDAVAYFADRLGVSSSYLTSGIPDGLHDELTFQLEEARILSRDGRATEADVVLVGLLEQVERFDVDELRPFALLLRGQTLLQMRRTREAIDRYEEALEHGLPEREQGIVTAALARAYRTVGDLSYAAELAESFLRVERAHPLDPAVLSDMHSALVSIYFERGDVLRAERSAQRALAAAEEAGNLHIRANAYWDAARVMAESKRWDEALGLASRARMIIEGFDDTRQLGRVRILNAFLCLEAEPPRLEEADGHLDAAERLLEIVGADEDRAQVYEQRSRLALMRGDAEVALSRARLAGSLVRTDELERARCLYLEGRALGMLGSPADAAGALKEAATAFAKLGARQQEASCWRELGELELAAGNTEEALEHLRSGLAAIDPSRSRA